MGPQAHRATLKKGQKSYKSKHATKGEIKARNKGKVEKAGQKSKPNRTMSKADRRNTAKQVREAKAAAALEQKRFFIGSFGVPKTITILSLCDDVDPFTVITHLNDSLDIETDIREHGSIVVKIDRFKQKLHYLVPNKTLEEYVSASVVADFVVLVFSSVQEVSQFGEESLRCIANMGVSNIIPVCTHMSKCDKSKTQDEIRQSLTSWVSHFFADADKLYCPEIRSEALNMIRSICEKTPKGVQWRDQRSYMLPEHIEPLGNGITAISGYLRGSPLSVDSLVYLNQAGAFQMECIKTTNSVIKPSRNQADLDQLSPEFNISSNDPRPSTRQPRDKKLGVEMIGVNYHADPGLHTAKNEQAPKRAANLPEGTSEYQAAWMIESDSESDDDDDYEDNESHELNASHDDSSCRVPDAEMEVDDEGDSNQSDQAVDTKASATQREGETNFDQKTYDEIKLHPRYDAKAQLAGFRGVRDIHTCAWDPNEPDVERPSIWNRLLRVHNFKAASNEALRMERYMPVLPGEYVSLFVRTGNTVIDRNSLSTVFGVLPYENKLTTLHTTIRIDSEADTEAFFSGDPLIAVIGPRAFKVYPRFSMMGNTPNNVYREEKVLAKGQILTASILAPFVVGNVPVLYLQESTRGVAMATGTVQDSSPDRIVAERVLVTGTIFKMHRRKVTIRHMFYTPEAVKWFRMVPLFTHHGRVGYIKEPLGTHGYFKAIFDGKLNSQDDVKMALYRRAWPISPEEILRANRGNDRYSRRTATTWTRT